MVEPLANTWKDTMLILWRVAPLKAMLGGSVFRILRDRAGAL
jgi:hypothetical protein